MREKNYKRVAADIAHAIAMGDFGDGGKLPSERRLSEIFGVSRVTIRTALGVQELRRLISRRHGSGTFVKAKKSIDLDSDAACFAFELVGKPLMENPYVLMCIEGMGKASMRHGLRFDLLPIPQGKTFLEHLKRKPGLIPKSKIILLGWNECQKESAEWLMGRGHFVVAIGPAGSVPGLSYVDMDNRLGGRLAARHLISLGRKKLAHINSSPDEVSVKNTLDGILEACSDAELAFSSALFRESLPWSEEGGFKAMESLLSEKVEMDSVIVRGDMASLGALKALKKAGLKAPEDISFVMYDDFPWMEKFCTPALTAIRQPFDDAAESALDIAVRSVRQGLCRHMTRILKPRLIVRESCGGSMLKSSVA